jgi:hypothetical protein
VSRPLRSNILISNDARRRIAALFLALIFAIQSGCATLDRAVPNTRYQATLGKVAVATTLQEPSIKFEGFARSKAQGAATGAGSTFAECLGGLGTGGGCSGAICGAAVLFWLGVCTVASAVSGVVGAADALSAAEVRGAEAGLSSALNTKAIQESLRDQVVAAAVAKGMKLASVTSAPTGDYRPLAAAGVDTVLEVSLTKVGTQGSGVNEPLTLNMEAHIRLIRTRDLTEVFATDYRHLGERLKLSEWSANGGQRLVRALENGYQSLGSHIYDCVFLLYPFPNRDSQWVGLLSPAFGLAPVFPAMRGVLTGDPFMGDRFEWITIDTLQPTFHWQRFPREADFKMAPEEMGRVKSVRYDVVVARESNLAPAEIVYRREGLSDTVHTMTTSLRPDTRYFWTVRARFDLDGRQRVTEWGSTNYAVREQFTVPSRFSYRFKTR